MYDEDNNSRRNAILGGLGAVFVVALIAIFFLKARTPESVPAPAAFRPYVASDKAFACKVPQEWRRQETGGMGIVSGVTVEKAGAQIDILSDLQGSLMGDMSRASNSQMESLQSMSPNGMALNIPKPKPPVEELHLAGVGKVKHSVEDFEEGPMREWHSPLGEARVSEWTGDAKGYFGTTSKVHGYRATILGGERRITVVCRCGEGDWPHLKQTFQTVMSSLVSGGG